jgi:GGDEF domain-containing protein
VFVLPDLAGEGAEELKPRLERAVEEAGQSICGAPVVTASIGCAFYPKDGATAEELLSEADRRMYESKETYYKQRREVTRLQVG